MRKEKCSLTWKMYSDHLKNMMKELMMNEDYSDVTLVTEDKKQIKANICILSACSPIFRDILKKENTSSTIVYLRGVQYSEIESILQFIYLGEATFYEDRMEEFLGVAKSLEIKELSNAETETNFAPKEEPSITEPETLDENLKKQTIVSDQFAKQPPQERTRGVVNCEKGRFDCKHCQKSFASQGGLYNHNKSIHEGVRYACDQCDHQATQQSHLTIHIQSRHERIKYTCDQCDSRFTDKSSLNRHIQSKHQGIKFGCDHCDFQSARQDNLSRHMMYEHKAVQFSY